MQTLAKGLKKMDSMEFNRARLSQSKSRPGHPALHELRAIEAHNDVEAVIIENILMSATSVLKGLVKNCPSDIVKEVEVVPAKYSLESGQVSILKRGWYSGRSIYFE